MFVRVVFGVGELMLKIGFAVYAVLVRIRRIRIRYW